MHFGPIAPSTGNQWFRFETATNSNPILTERSILRVNEFRLQNILL